MSTYQIGQEVNTPFNRRATIVKIRPGYCAPYQVRFPNFFEWAFDKKELDTANTTPPLKEATP